MPPSSFRPYTGSCVTTAESAYVLPSVLASHCVPQRPAYRPKLFLRSQRPDALLEVEEIRAHVEWIEQLLTTGLARAPTAPSNPAPPVR